MTCNACGSKLELTRYSREHSDEQGPKLVYECSWEECEDKTTKVARQHTAVPPITLNELRSNYFRHALEIN